MKIDPRCKCMTCTINKMEDAINEPIPNIVKFETIRMDFLNVFEYEKSTNYVFSDESLKVIELIKKIDCYNEINDILSDIDIVRLYLKHSIKCSNKESSFDMLVKGIPRYSVNDVQKRTYALLDNKKTIFDVKVID